MKWRKGLRAASGVALCVVGFALARGSNYRETAVTIGADGCHLVTDVVDRGDDAQGYVVLFHGLAANKKIMAYLERAFAEQNLRVFVPDLPGHGRTPGPFSFARAEACSESLVRELIARRAIDPRRTILAGHSMGGAIAIRVGARVSVGGVIAISPAPMRVAHGIPADMLPYTDPPPLPPHTLAISATFEPLGIRESTRDLVAGDAGASSEYLLIPRATHVSVLFDGRVARAAQDRAAKTLGLASCASVPSSAPLAGSLLGLAGILLLAGPFLRETLGSPQKTTGIAPADLASTTDTSKPLPLFRVLLEAALASFFAVALLKFWNPLLFVRLYNGGYFASFLLITGLILLGVHYKSARALWPLKLHTLVVAGFAGLVLHLLVTVWFDATLTEAWLTGGRWARLPVFFIAALFYLLAEEMPLGAPRPGRMWARFLLAFAMRLVAFLVLVFGIFVLHSGAILLILLALFLAVFFVLQRLGMDLVRQETGSAVAAAVFGAILLAGFCLVIFPVT